MTVKKRTLDVELQVRQNVACFIEFVNNAFPFFFLKELLKGLYVGPPTRL